VDVQDWWSGGELVALELSGTEQGVFVRREGSGPSMTLLHGFPSSSQDWAKIAPALAEHYALTMPDLLGFGASTKPREHRYSLLEQADLVEALWVREGIESTVVVAHDYSVSVAQELLTRRAIGALAVELRALHFMNGGINEKYLQMGGVFGPAGFPIGDAGLFDSLSGTVCDDPGQLLLQLLSGSLERRNKLAR